MLLCLAFDFILYAFPFTKYGSTVSNQNLSSLQSLTIETVEHNSMRVEQENRDLKLEKIMWESERRRLESSLEEARVERRKLEDTLEEVRAESRKYKFKFQQKHFCLYCSTIFIVS